MVTSFINFSQYNLSVQRKKEPGFDNICINKDLSVHFVRHLAMTVHIILCR
jgi:hypothetical protein